MATTGVTSSSATMASVGSFYNDVPSSPGSSDASKDLKDPSRTSASSARPPGSLTSPYPQQIDPSPIESTGTTSTDATDIDEDEEDIRRTSVRAIDDTLPAGSEDADTTSKKQSVTDPGAQNIETMAIPPSDQTASNHHIKQVTSFAADGPQSYNSLTMGGIVPRPPSSQSGNPSGTPRKDSATSPLNTDLPPVKVVDRSTPRAQTRQEAEDEWQRRSHRSISLEDISESGGSDRKSGAAWSNDVLALNGVLQSWSKEHQQQIESLNTALSECWTLCTTLAGLSSNHRSLLFAYRGKAQVQEQAWTSCWRLCQSLYDTRESDHAELVLPTLEMCREFCQSLFEARHRQDEASDSVLRVSFELNNHLYNTHDRNLPSAFQERTLDFYLTLCHRLMKQRTSLPQETDCLLRACWTLAEMLFNIRQNNRDGNMADEELLSSAVQACWDLCDLFREGWSQARPGTERGTPRSTRSALAQSPVSVHSHSQISFKSSSSIPPSTSSRSFRGPRPFPPETPTTIFDDNAESPMEGAGQASVPNILVLGPDQSSTSTLAGRHSRWPSSASTLSGYTDSSHRTSSTATAPHMAAVMSHLGRIRILLFRTAVIVGFEPTWSSPPSDAGSSPKLLRAAQAQAQSDALSVFVQALPDTAFGSQKWQSRLLVQFRRLIDAWPTVVQSGTASAMHSVRNAGSRPNAKEVPAGMSLMIVVAPQSQKRATPVEIASAVKWMMRSERNAWLRDLFRFVFGYVPEDAAEGVGSAVSG